MGFFVKVVAFRTASSMPSPTNERNNRSQSIRSSQLLLQANGTVRLRQHGSHQSLPAGSSPANRQSNLSNITVRDFSCRIGDRVTRSGSSAQIRFSRSNVNILHFGPSPMHVPSGGPPIAQRTLGLGPAPPPGWLGQCRLQYFADEARVRHAPRLRANSSPPPSEWQAAAYCFVPIKSRNQPFVHLFKNVRMYVQLQAALWEPLAFPGGGLEAFKNHLAQAGEQLRLRGLQMDPAVIPIFPTNAVCLRLHELAF